MELYNMIMSGRLTCTGDYWRKPTSTTGEGSIYNGFFMALPDYNRLPSIKKVIFSGPATIVFWEDNSPKTVVKLQPGDQYSKELGLAMCICKKALGNKSNFNNVFEKWVYSQEDEKDQLYNDIQGLFERILSK